MVNRRRRRLGFAIAAMAVLVLVMHCGPQAPEKPLAAHQAVAKAEHFIRVNEYTSYRVWPWANLQPESIEFLPRDEWREFRYNTLEARAHGWLRGRKRGEPGWTVVFRYTTPVGSPTGRAVTMNPDGSDIRIEHVDFFLNAVERN